MESPDLYLQKQNSVQSDKCNNDKGQQKSKFDKGKKEDMECDTMTLDKDAQSHEAKLDLYDNEDSMILITKSGEKRELVFREDRHKYESLTKFSVHNDIISSYPDVVAYSINRRSSVFDVVDAKADVAEEVNSLKTYKNYTKLNLTFAITNFIDSLSHNIDSLIATLIFNDTKLAAQLSIDNFSEIIWAFGVGFGYAISSDLSGLIVRQKIPLSKRVAILACLLVFTLGLIVSSFVIFFRESFAKCLNGDEKSREYMMEILYPWLFFQIFDLLQQAIWGICKSINKERVYFVCLVICHIIIHYVSLFF